MPTAHDLKFRPVELRDAPLLQEYFERWPSRSCDFTVGGVILWKEYFGYELAEACGTLLLKGFDPADSRYIFHMPVGPGDWKAWLPVLSHYCRIHGICGKLMIPCEDENPVSPSDEGIFDPAWREYLYNADKFTTFAGKKMEKKRNHLHFFVNNYSPFEVVEIDKDIIPELIDFTLSFEAVHNDSELSIYESSQMVEGLRNWEEYPFHGIAVRKENRILGYTFGEKSSDAFVIHAEKGDTSFRGIYQLISSELGKSVKSRFPEINYLNREDDMGDEGLRESKMSYHPEKFIYKRVILL